MEMQVLLVMWARVSQDRRDRRGSLVILATRAFTEQRVFPAFPAWLVYLGSKENKARWGCPDVLG
jgi:hypothetical protein